MVDDDVALDLVERIAEALEVISDNLIRIADAIERPETESLQAVRDDVQA